MFERTIESPVGSLRLVASEGALVAIDFGASMRNDETLVLREAERQLGEYFRGERREFDLELELSGTAFQRSVWAALARIPFGTTVSYRELAARVGRPKAVRAVGGANGRNPFSIVLPCHRVVGADGTLTGYGGGLERKAWLLRHEGVSAARRGPGGGPRRARGRAASASAGAR